MKTRSRSCFAQRALLALAAVFSPAATLAQLSMVDDAALEEAVATTLSEVVVTGHAAEQGSAADGYRVETTKGVGLWGERSLQDTPYSMTVTSQALIENSAAKDMNQIFKMNPTAQETANIASDATDNMKVTLRGFVVSNPVINGIPSSTRVAGTPSMQDLERVEVINGATGFLYGGGRVGGAVNYVTKKPTLENLRAISTGTYGGQSRFAHVDLGGQFNQDKTVGYRINAMGQGGQTARKDVRDQKTLSLVLDWRPTSDFSTDVRYSYKDTTASGPNMFWNDDVDRKLVSKNQTFTPKWLTQDFSSHKLEHTLSWTLNPVFALRTNLMLEKVERTGGDMRLILKKNNRIVGEKKVGDNTGSWMGDYGVRENKKIGASVYLDSTFDTFGISHRLTTGGSLARDKSIAPQGRGSNTRYLPDDISLDEVRNQPKPANWGAAMPRQRNSRDEYRNVLIGDDIIVNDQWTVMVGGNYATAISQSYIKRSKYDKSAFTPTLSLSYKPAGSLTTYATYIESLENGQVVGEGYLNEGEVLPPYTSKQYEVGAKYTANDRLSINSALFRIEKANKYGKAVKAGEKPTDRLTQDGQQLHQGFELGIIGKVTNKLTVMAGGTVLDLGIEKASKAALQGKKPTDAAAYMAKIFAEYRVPGVAGLFLSGGAYYTGKKYADEDNRHVVPAYTLFDLGLRFETKISGAPTTFNLSVQNLTDKVYWTGSTSLGEPRSIAFTVKSQF